MDSLKDISSKFDFSGEYEGCEEMHSGNINKTYRVFYRQTTGEIKDYIVQNINTYVFKSPENVMENIVSVTNHLRKKLSENSQDALRGVLTIIPTKDGGSFYKSTQGDYWRAYIYVTNAIGYDRVEKPEHFYQAGRAFGEFQKLLSDYHADTLHEIIPGFHDTPKRVETFKAAVARDASKRSSSVREEIDFVLSGAEKAGRIMALLDSKELALRVTHNDTKINNVLIDTTTQEAVCVIDLDTVMPGSSLFDFGDAIRFGASTAAEDEPDISKVSLDLSLYSEFTKGFLSAVKGFLPDSEIRLLPLGVWTITYELAMRFLTDYIDGDVYFKVNSPEHNIIRARCQLQLLRDIEKKEEAMLKLIDEFLSGK